MDQGQGADSEAEMLREWCESNDSGVLHWPPNYLGLHEFHFNNLKLKLIREKQANCDH